MLEMDASRNSTLLGNLLRYEHKLGVKADSDVMNI